MPGGGGGGYNFKLKRSMEISKNMLEFIVLGGGGSWDP